MRALVHILIFCTLDKAPTSPYYAGTFCILNSPSTRNGPDVAEPISLLGYPDLTEKTYLVLRDQIVTGQLHPGLKLLVVEQAQRLGVSRTPVKDALNRLSAEGLVARLPRKGYLVSPLDFDDVADLMDARLMVELATAERAIERAQPSDLAEMCRLVSEMEGLIDEHGAYLDYPQCSTLDCDLHLLIVSMAGNRRLTEIYRGLNVHNYMARMHHASELMQHHVVHMLKDHRTILEAFESRDLAALKAAIAINIRGFMHAFEAITRQY